MSNTMEYKGYLGTVEFSAEDGCLYGKIEHINDLIMFDGQTVDEVKTAFEDAVDSYLAFCAENGKEPNQPFKGTFNIRPGPALHRKAAIEARKQGLTLNDFVAKAIAAYLEKDTKVVRHEHTHSITRTIEFSDERRFWSVAERSVVIGAPSKGECH